MKETTVKEKTLREKIKNHEKTIGMHVYLNDVTSARIAGLAGYDFVWIDLEHSNLSLELLPGHIIALQAGGTAVIVRVPQDDLTYTKKVVEMGVDGIIFPQVKSAGQANALIASTLYPPYGNRGYGPLNATGYGFYDVKEYIKNAPEHFCRFIQIEHVDAVSNLDEIMKNEYIDGYIFGPNDLSGSINQLGQVFSEDTTALIKKAVAKLKAAGKYIGLSTGDISDKTLQHWHDMGVDMLSAGADYSFIRRLALQNRINMERIHKFSAE
ncbi:MAG: aldolase [Lachnospiraceae bacterium]|nr:aldolase [Lachnospiraceae bacterium]